MSALFAFLHHIAAFTLFAALVVEFVAIKDELTVRSARRIKVADAVVGISAGIVLAAGLLRVFYFEKGAAYYFNSVPFIAKLSLFVLISLISIYPTTAFLSWRAPLKDGRVPTLTPEQLRAIRAIVHIELTGMVLLMLLAVLMARGYGFLG